MAATVHGLFFGRVAPSSKQRRAIDVPALVVGHPRDPIHPAADAEMLADELVGARFVAARSILEWRMSPERLDDIAATFVAECFDTAAGTRSLGGCTADLECDGFCRFPALCTATLRTRRGSHERRHTRVRSRSAFILGIQQLLGREHADPRIAQYLFLLPVALDVSWSTWSSITTSAPVRRRARASSLGATGLAVGRTTLSARA